ncbi:unnamed protein product [Cylicostephanus goldi]|uniref:Phlebovirus glycoprotein G2 fusion domain-containing protein n=1 Tax=Cylicostephanus goldi TaxID=71465 RepID=A0A3P7QU51_CYLGO|nr:unnamed protein product [Cylicostephanus goldi]
MITIILFYFCYIHYCTAQADSVDLSIPEDAVGRPQNLVPIRNESLNDPTRNLCFCNYAGDICDSNNTCIKHTFAACFHFMKEVNFSHFESSKSCANISFSLRIIQILSSMT